MYQPGQPLWAKSYKTSDLVMFVGPEKNPKYQYYKSFDVLRYDHEANDVVPDIFDMKDLYPLVVADENSLTGQAVFKGFPDEKGNYPLLKKSWSTAITQEEIEDNINKYFDLLNNVWNSNWFQEKYVPQKQNKK